MAWKPVPAIPGGHLNVSQCLEPLCGAFVRGEEAQWSHYQAFHSCQECGTFVGQPHGWGCDLVLHGEVELVWSEEHQHTVPPLVTQQDCED